MNFLKVWTNTFLKRSKVKTDFMSGIGSVVLSSLVVGILTFAMLMLQPSNSDVGMSFAFLVIGMPIIALIALLIMTAIFRGLAELSGGKSSFKKDCGVIGVYLGSLIFVVGIFSILWGALTSAAFPGFDIATGAGIATTNLMLFYLVEGLGMAIQLVFVVIVLGILLEELSAAEKLSMFETAKALGLSIAVLFLLYNVVLGAMFELTLGPYKSTLEQYYQGISGV
jgi:hypothetical protein